MLHQSNCSWEKSTGMSKKLATISDVTFYIVHCLKSGEFTGKHEFITCIMYDGVHPHYPHRVMMFLFLGVHYDVIPLGYITMFEVPL